MDRNTSIVDDDEAVALVVEELRTAADLSVNQLSKHARVPHTTLLRRLAGDPFKLDEIRRVARVLDTTVDAIEAAAQQRVTA